MNKYVRAAVCAATGLLKTSVLKLGKGSAFNGGFIALISPLTEITVDRGGKLSWGKLIKIRSGSKIRVRKGAICKIGDNFSMSNNCVLTAHESIVIGNGVQFGPGVLVYDHDHDFRASGGLAAKKYKTTPIEIGNNVWIGANSIILRGTKIGDNCVVGAGTIVKGNFLDNSLICQNRETKISQIKK